ncbi:MAG: hypothetical protein EBU84_00685 [Actinobacteria bacterium]|nr:hypothetical protein [Actinomycetota bacterium]
MTQCNLVAFDTEDDSKRFSDANQDHPGYEKICTQIAAIDARTGERFHHRPTVTKKRKRGRFSEPVWDVQPFLDWLEARGPIRCFAHNLAYDIGNIWRDRLDELDITLVGNRLVRAKWKNVTLLDSSNVWPMPLAKVGKSLGLEKLEMDVESEEYVFRDVEIVIEAMALAERICTQYDAPMKSTLGSISISIWGGNIMGGSNWQCSMPCTRNAYYGGRVELFKTHATGSDIYYTDINSLYPSVMLNKFPDAADQNFGEKTLAKAKKLLTSKDELYGVVHCDIDIPEDMLISPLPVKREGSGEVCFPVGPVSGWWTVHEVRHALSRGCKLKKLHGAYGSRTGSYYYREFVRTFYRLRKEELDKPQPDEGKTLFYKLLMNNLYGQLGMKGTITRGIHLTQDMVDFDEDGEMYLTRPGIPFGNKLLCEIAMPLPEHVNYLHAAYVTSYGRLKLMHYMEKVGPENLIYCDTDSLFFTWSKSKLPFPLSTELGEMKLEDRPLWVETRSPKMYRYETPKKGTVTKAKGVPKKMQDKFYDTGCADFWQPWRLRESIICADRIPDPDDEAVKIVGVWRKVLKRVVSAYDKKRLSGDRYLPKKMVDIGADHETLPVS